MNIASCVARKITSSNAERLIDADQEFDLIDSSYQNLSVLPDYIVQNSLVVKHLILDGNNLNENAFEGVRFPELESLSINSNNIINVGVFVQHLSHKCPNLRFLSLIGNPGWPHPTLTNNWQLYQDYIRGVSKFFPKLSFVDSVAIEGSRKSSTISNCSTSSSSSYSSKSSTCSSDY